MPEWRCSLLYQPKNPWQNWRACFGERKRSGKSGRYLRVLNWDSEKGLSLGQWGREWLLVTPKSARRKATGLEAMEEPRSAWRVSWLGSRPYLRMVCSIRILASSELSRSATIQPTTKRLKMS